MAPPMNGRATWIPVSEHENHPANTLLCKFSDYASLMQPFETQNDVEFIPKNQEYRAVDS